MNFADQEEIAQRMERRRKRQRRDAVWNVLSWIVLFLSGIVVLIVAAIFVNPVLPLNPFPPATLPVLATSPVVTPALSVIPATSTPIILPTATTAPTETITPNPSPTVSLPTPTSDLGVLYPFVLKSNPIPMSNLVFHPDGDCSWQGIAGQVQDMQGRPVRGLSVHLIGSYNGRAVDMTTLSGAAQAWYGESGFEFVLGTTPLDSKDELYLQLADQGMVALSAAVPVETFSACDKNLVLVNFKQVR
jgi:hypothetical protein